MVRVSYISRRRLVRTITVWRKHSGFLLWWCRIRMEICALWWIWPVSSISWKTWLRSLYKIVWTPLIMIHGKENSWRTLTMIRRRIKMRHWILRSAWCWRPRTGCSRSRSMSTITRIAGVPINRYCIIRWIAGLSARPLAVSAWSSWTIRSTGNRRARVRDVSANGWRTCKTGTWAAVVIGVLRYRSGVRKMVARRSVSVPW